MGQMKQNGRVLGRQLGRAEYFRKAIHMKFMCDKMAL